MKNIEVKILEQSFTLACKPEDEASLLQAVALVNEKMTQMRDAAKIKTFERQAIMTALQLAGDFLQIESGAGINVAHLQSVLTQTHLALDAGLAPQEKLF